MTEATTELGHEPVLKEDLVLCLNDVSKKFCRSLKKSLVYGVQDIASEVLGLRQQCDRLRSGEFWALQNVSLELGRGESLGLVGANGSGKTTLLRIISGLIKPDTGRVHIRGRVAPLIALGAGFNPVLTGRENIYANMAILGLSKPEIDQRYDAVVEFAEIGEAIESPVHSYSSGMAARLGFACAIYTNPDILLIDEVLSVGDIRFRLKCDRALHQLQAQGTSLIVISHFFQGILNICTKALYLSRGEVRAYGDARSIMDKYDLELITVGNASPSLPFFPVAKEELQSSGVGITGVYFRNSQNTIIDVPVSGEEVSFCVSCNVSRQIDRLGLYLYIYQPAQDNSLMIHVSQEYDGKTFKVSAGKYELRLYFLPLALLRGSYTAKVALKDGSLYALDAYDSLSFDVSSNEVVNRGLLYQKRQWTIS
ncbi:MAG: ABC transporter ATP-binding protein [Cyanobacteria bacterium REEB459]|nr:ABC transporter ATP-binding protein [Cyanobacteria bacterium REEB459]